MELSIDSSSKPTILCRFSFTRFIQECAVCREDREFFSPKYQVILAAACNILSDLRDESSKGLDLKIWNYEDKQRLLNKLAEMMLDCEKGLCIAEHFQCILLEVLSRTKQIVDNDATKKHQSHLKFSATLSYLLEGHLYLLPFILRYFKQLGPFFGGTPRTAEETAQVIQTAYHLLSFSPAMFCNVLDWSLLCESNYLENTETARYFLKSLSVILKLNNDEKLTFFKAFDNQNASPDSFPASKSSKVERRDTKDTINEVVFTEKDLCGRYVIAANILLPRISSTAGFSSDLVAVPSMLKNVGALTIALVSQKAILLSGSVGSGKTSLVEHFAGLTGRGSAPSLLKVQLGDQTDSKALIGSYCCSEVAGEFVWRPGILTRAVKEGRWLLLEDIDCAPMDVVSILIPLLESRSLSIPGKGNIQASPGFQLFATQRVGLHAGFKGFNSESSMLDHLWSKVHIEPLNKDELQMVVRTRFSNLEPLANKLVDIFSMLSSDLTMISQADTKLSSLSMNKRLSTVRDFVKWCTRVDKLSATSHTNVTAQDIFVEALDCFCATFPDASNRLSVAVAVGVKLNMNKAKVEFVCNLYKPAIHVAPLSFTVGRITLTRKNNETGLGNASDARFAFTRHSLVLLESVAVCVSQNEPVLLVGETGTGKTSAIQYLASMCGHTLTVVNMSQQSDSTDLIGGFKPMEMKQLVAPVRAEFEKIFCKSFSRKQNTSFLTHVQQCFGKGKWELLFKLMLHSQGAALTKISKSTSNVDTSLLSCWQKIGQRIEQLKVQHKQAESSLAFSFVEGALVKAIKRGDWVLLDEINLATPETLECLNGILESKWGSVVVLERGDAEAVVRHEEFRIFACMNPANDVGKKDLPVGIRNRFTEIFVNELKDEGDLKTLVVDYLKGLSPTAALINGIVSFYLEMREEASEKLADGSGNKPYYSLRTLCRALKYASRNPHGSILRSVYEGFCISFLTQLDRSSHNLVQTLLQQKILGHVNGSCLLKQPLPKPVTQGEESINFEGYWIYRGNLEAVQSPEYIFTSSVRQNLRDLARIVSGRYFPVLIQGETAVGKTSLINWLAKASGNHCVRINNHEHTDIQEYLGCYTSDERGKLVFKEGILVDAMRKGYWIILDELNLAPTDVLEALNRLLDDNRELFIPEIQETVKAHGKFMLFATQNPPGQYGGRKILSRAFRNRFVELHFQELPSKELETILHKRCLLPQSYSKKLVNVMLDLQVRRRGSRIFAGKQGFITLRDLFRWADRYSKSPNHEGEFFDWDQQLAEDGYFLLAGRCRNCQESRVVQEVIEKHLRRKIEMDNLFGNPSKNSLSSSSNRILSHVISNCPDAYHHVVFTYNMRRLAVLVGRALEFNEPVLLVGETGCGKTTICQLFSALRDQKLYSINCHMHTETSDFLGGLRPVRIQNDENEDRVFKLFEWCDGPLVLAMRGGDMFLADEISLADDSVLERLNSVLEPERTLVLAEKGSAGDPKTQQDIDQIVAEQGFHLLATMNPGGDYGKKELSPALRNRFTEIWCPANDNPSDIIEIIEHNLNPGIVFTPQVDGSSGVGKTMIQFIDWLKKCNFGKRCTVTVRDFLSWVQFINICSSSRIGCSTLHPALAYVHGAFLVFLDALGLGMSTPFVKTERIGDSRQTCSNFLYHQVKDISGFQHLDEFETGIQLMGSEDSELFTISGFSIRRGPTPLSVTPHQYALNAPTTAQNAARVLRALQLHRPILLEGSPGVGKTSLVSALAKASGHNLVRMNLSEQTDISELFGADLPVEGGNGCRFSWCDGPLLQALKSGSWVVLDELNLASQSVLEGLNACFDHRGEIFIPELGMTFQVQHEKTRFFACQNPLSQGGGRKGLPKSFLNRFTQVYIEPLSKADLVFITEAMYPNIVKNTLDKMITFNNKIYQQCVIEGLYGKQGGSWEFNLRDIFRWCDLMMKYQGVRHWNPVPFVHLIYIDRMRTELDRKQVWNLCLSIFGENATKETSPLVHVTPSHVQVGRCVFPKSCSEIRKDCFQTKPLLLLHRSLKPLESLLTCLQMNWMAILIGPKSCGKTSLVKMSAELTGSKLDVMAMNSATDTTELLGGYEQVDLRNTWNDLKDIAKNEVLFTSRTLVLSKSVENVLIDVKHLLHLWYTFSEENPSDIDHSQIMASRPPSMLDAVTQLINLTYEAISICHRHHLPILTFERLKKDVSYLRTRLIECNGNPHVSGQFQWVDGQLVQALKRGYWLLIDNVNFCSPSVLDRLNALLEPGGVLAINERGVVDGKIPVIQPHPNFRLILAMDSKHGEISRAMRNRGVEIFLMEEGNGKSCSQHDLHGILQAVGCRNPRAVNGLTSYHEKCKDSLGGTLLNVVHAGSLLNELMQRRNDLKTSFAMSVNHVYGQNEDEFVCDLSCMVTPIQQELPPTTLFYHDSTVAMIQRHAIPLIKMLQEPTVLHGRIRISIMLFLEWCNKHDWRLRLHWLESNVRSIHPNHDFNDICSVAEFSLQEIFQSPLLRQLYCVYEILDKNLGNKLRPAYQPFNIKVNGPMYGYIHCASSSDEEILSLLVSLTNRLYLLGFHLQIEARMRSYSDCLASQSNLSTPLNISFAFSRGLIMLEDLPHAGFTHIYPLCRSFQDFLRHLIEASDIFITDDDAFKVWTSLKHYRRFLDVCESRYTLDEDFQDFFGLHWKLFKKNTFSTFCENICKKNSKINIPGEVLSVVSCLDELFTCADDEVAQCHWTLIDQFGHPATFVFQELRDLWDSATKVLLDLSHHHTNMTAAAKLSYLKTREQQNVLVKNMELLIKLREERVQKENVEDILRCIDKSTKDIEHQVFEHDVMDSSSSLDVVQQFFETTQSDESEKEAANFTEIMNCDIFQSLSAVLVNSSFLGCLSAIKLACLQEKLGSRMVVCDFNQQLESYHEFCQKYVKQIPLNTAYIRYLLFTEMNGNGLPKALSSMFQLTDSIAFHTYSEMESMDSYSERQATTNLTSSSRSSYNARSFQALLFPTEVEECSGDLDRHTPIRLIDLKEKVIQFDNLANLFWLNQNYIGIMESKLFDSDWKLLVIAFIRFLHCTTVITSKEFPDVNQIFTILLGTSKVDELPRKLWTALESIIGAVVESYGNACNHKDIQVVQECFQRLIYCLKAGMKEVPETADFSTNSSSQLTRGLSWVYLGVLKTTVLRPLGNVDPVEESNVRVRIHKDEIVEVENELQVRLNTEEMLTGVCTDKTYRDSDLLSFTQVNPSHVENLVRHRASLKLELSVIGEEIAFRPIPSKFREIRNILDHFSSSVGSYAEILDLLSRLRKLIEYQNDDEMKYLAAIGEVKGMLLNLKMWTKSVKKFLSRLAEYTAYQDILGPYMSGLCQILQGMDFIVNSSSGMLSWKVFKMKAQRRKFGEVCVPQDILNYLLPFRNTLDSSFTRCERLLHEKVFNGVEVLCEKSEGCNEHLALRSATLKSKIRKLGLTLLQDSVCRSGYTKPRDIYLLKNTIDYYVSMWLQYEEQRRLTEQEEASLYKFKTKVYDLDESEEEREEKEIAELFTSFDQEYNDTESGMDDTPTRDKKGETCNKKEMDFDPFQISDGEVNHLCEVHKFLVSALPNACQIVTTLNEVKWRKEEERLDVVRVIVERYNMAADLVNIGNLSDADLVDDTTQNHLFMSSLLAKSLSSFNETTEEDSDNFYSAVFSQKRQNYDIYHDCNLKEVSRVLPMLSRFSSRLDQLLQEWPEHPALVQLTRTINQIVTFSVTSPVIKILNGLELLLSQAQEWEANASRQVSIKSHLYGVTEMIIRWRKLELSCWSSLLLVCEERARKKANHWWFHIYHVIQQYSEDNSRDFRELAQVFQKFIEGSSLGEFSERLNILYSFYCQTVIDENRSVTSSGSVKTVLWNVCCYYKQFECQVITSLQKAKTPIEKELKDFIKIAKWKDVYYWAMKQAAKKSHYTLLKLVKKYQVALAEPVDQVLSFVGQVLFSEDADEAESWQKMEVVGHLASLHFKDILGNSVVEEVHEEHRSCFDISPSQMFVKMRKLTQKALGALKYERLAGHLNELTGEIISKTHSLQILNVGDKSGKKRAEFRNHIQVRKKRALADLFKALRKLGLSYRKGMTLRQQEALKDSMLVECCDLASRITNIDKIINNTNHSVKRSILATLNNGLEYYQKSVARSAVLYNVLPSPSQELTVGDVNRIKGFSEDLRHITQRQRENLSCVGILYSDLRMMYLQLEEIATTLQLPTQPCVLPPQKDIADWTVMLDDVLNISSQTCTNLLLLLDTCPNSKIDSHMSPVPQHLSQLSKSCKQDPAFVRERDSLKIFLEEVSTIKSAAYLQTLTLYSLGTEGRENSGMFLATWSHCEFLKSSFSKLNCISQNLDQFIKFDTRDHGLGKLAFLLKEKLVKTCNDFFVWQTRTFDMAAGSHTAGELSTLRSKVTLTLEGIVLSFQKWFKRREKKIPNSKEDPVSDDENLFDGKYLVENLDDELSEDIATLNVAERTEDLKSVIILLRETIDHHYKEKNINAIEISWKVVINLVPCLSQYVLLVEYYFSQLLLCHRNTCKLHSVLLGIFSELLRKGFCLPPDEEEAGGEGATSFEDSENCGIGEGEGRKDVSDQIEDEEQLLGAETEKNKEEQEMDNDFVDEEEHGIEMTDDFEATANDMDEHEENEDEGSDEQNDDDIAQQMGNVDGGDEKLDDKLWGDSDDDEEDVNDNSKEERGEGANAEDESDLVAKEENQGTAEESKKNLNNDDEEKEEEAIHELPKDESDQGNLDDENELGHSQNENELNLDTGKPEDMVLSDDLDLDAGSDQEESYRNEEEESQIDTEQESTEPIDEAQTEDGVRVDAKDEDDTGNEEIDDTETKGDVVREDEESEPDMDQIEELDESSENWRTESETKGDNTEATEDRGTPDQSAGTASNERLECEPNEKEEAATEEEKDGTGSTLSQQSGQDGSTRTTTHISSHLTLEGMSSYRKQLNKSRADRSLGSSDETTNKRPKIIDSSSETSSNQNQREQRSTSDLVEHLKGDDEVHDSQVYDAATLKQLKEQRSTANYDDTENGNDDEEEHMDEDWELPCEDNSRGNETKKDDVDRESRPLSQKTSSTEAQDLELPPEEIDRSSPHPDKHNVNELERSFVHLGQIVSTADNDTGLLDPVECRIELEKQLDKWHELDHGTADEQRDAQEAWHKYGLLTSGLSQQLCEQLRIVLEPSIANKLKGDYRTGKRLNMRKVIPYIASQFRKDKIWLRRTKKSKRQYQILIAVDDSSSMADNHSKQLAFESLAVITNALTRLEAGEIAICSFGENVELLHPFHETFTDQSGASILRQFTFEQKKTKIAQLVDSCTSIMISARSRLQQGAGARSDTSQLLFIVSDGRGIFLEGVETVQRVVRMAKEAGIFLVFVILDNPANKDSVLDIKVPVFRPGQLPELKSYIEQFPFPFYILLRDISALPETLSDSLRQWFELVTNMS